MDYWIRRNAKFGNNSPTSPLTKPFSSLDPFSNQKQIESLGLDLEWVKWFWSSRIFYGRSKVFFKKIFKDVPFYRHKNVEIFYSFLIILQFSCMLNIAIFWSLFEISFPIPAFPESNNWSIIVNCLIWFFLISGALVLMIKIYNRRVEKIEKIFAKLELIPSESEFLLRNRTLCEKFEYVISNDYIIDENLQSIKLAKFLSWALDLALKEKSEVLMKTLEIFVPKFSYLYNLNMKASFHEWPSPEKLSEKERNDPNSIVKWFFKNDPGAVENVFIFSAETLMNIYDLSSMDEVELPDLEALE